MEIFRELEDHARWRTEVETQQAYVLRQINIGLEYTKHQRDDISGFRRQLEEVRKSEAYQRVFDEPEPLVTVRIASVKGAEFLIDIALKSVLNQTYDRFEVVVVNDGPNDATRKAIDALGDSRIRYVEFPERQTYPDDPYSRWMVAGAPGMNLGADLASGLWIAPLDDDDEFTPDHLEKLIGLALTQQVELSYGALIMKQAVGNTEHLIWSSPPALNEFSFQGALYMKALNFFKYDERSWAVNEPADWNLMRRMMASGVSYATTTDVVGTMHSVPYTLKT